MHRCGGDALLQSQTKTMRFTLPTDFAASQDAQRQIIQEAMRQGYAPLPCFAIQLALEEAIVNAIKHGNHYDQTKRIYLQAKVGPEETEITVEDEGKGFDRCEVPDPRCDENLEKCSGRGILLIESYMNSVKWSNRGRRVTMVRRNDLNDCPRGCC
jgi:serine/threonine-protein kinase RsbW